MTARTITALVATAGVLTAVGVMRPDPAGPGQVVLRPDYPIQAVPLAAVHVTGGFWQGRLEANRRATIPHVMRQNELTGRVDNFLKAARRKPGSHEGQRYNDTDVYKIIEAASYVLATAPDPSLDRQLDDLIAVVAAAQEPDGYLYTPRSVDPAHPAAGAGPDRWSQLATSHELYNAGHLYEAAVAHYQATGKRTLLDVALKSADLVCQEFGPGARRDVPGHEEVELALVKLYRVTGRRRYLDQARFFLAERGRPRATPHPTFEPGSRFEIYNDLAYRQDHQPVTAEARAVGHAVRATYLYAGLTDVGVLSDDVAFSRTASSMWRDVTSRRMYVTGGLGSEGRTEAFGADYELPNRAYAETCASIGGMLWYHRMFLRDGDGAYYDVLERTLYNGYLSGVSIEGDTFFYQNPLVSDGQVGRQAYFDVACCPANLARLMAQLPGLVYAQRERGAEPGARDEVYVNLFVQSRADIQLGHGRAIELRQDSRYPWDGRVRITVDPKDAGPFTMKVRIPGWARDEAVPSDLYRFTDASAEPPVVRVNGQAVTLALDKGYVALARTWHAGDVVDLVLPMPVRLVRAHDAVVNLRGHVAIQRGPLVYCVEAVDNGGGVSGRRLPLDAQLTHDFRSDLLGGVEVVSARAGAVAEPGGARTDSLLAVPYFAWANRGRGEMAVWLPR